jgi:hypothetical protein
VDTPENYEAQYQYFMYDLPSCVPDGIISIDLAFLHSIGLLTCSNLESDLTRSLTNYFHVVESWEKITLYNQKFVIWIVPRVIEGVPTTYTLISFASEKDITSLELVYATSGIYNAPRLILRVLEHFLKDIEENENLIAQIQ